MLPYKRAVISGRNDRNVGCRQLLPGFGDRTGSLSAADVMLPGAELNAAEETRLDVGAASNLESNGI